MRAVLLTLCLGYSCAMLAVAEDDVAPPATTGRRADATGERLAREFRIATYNAFRADRDELARRQAAWARVEAAWKAAGERPADREALYDWLRGAASAARSSPPRPLPPSPRFGEQAASPAPSERPLKPMPGDIDRAAPKHPTPNRPRSGIPDAPPAYSDSPARSAPRLPADPARPTNDLAAPRAGQTPRSATPPAGVLVDPMRTPRGIAPQRFSGPPAPTVTPSREPSAAPAGVAPPGTANGTPPLESIAGRASDTTARRDELVSPPRPASPGPLSPALDTQPAEGAAARVPPEPSRVSPPRDFGPPLVNVDELAARATAHNRALADVDRRLAKQADWSAAELQQVVARLTELQVLGADLNLVRELVPPAERAAVERPGSAAALVTAVAAKVQAARQDLMENSTSLDPADRDAQLETLDRLSAQLVKLHQGERPRDANQQLRDRN